MYRVSREYTGTQDRMLMREHWKEPETTIRRAATKDYKVGIWSRSFALRTIVWIISILVVVVLALVVTAYLSGFDSVSEMIQWYRSSFHF